MMSESVEASCSEDQVKKEDENLWTIFEGSQATFNEEPARWLGLVRDKLFSMFRSPIKEEYSREAFRWISQLCITAGDFSWMTTTDRWTQDEALIFSCIARLSLAEVQILLPLICRHLSHGDEPDIENGRILDRSADHEDYDRFGTQLVIIESIIKSLVKDQSDEGTDEQPSRELNPVTDAMTPDELKNLLERLKETMASICDYLELVNRQWQYLIKDVDDMKFSSAQGALRIMSVWLSEDPGGFDAQCKRFLIELMIKNFLLNDKSSRNDLTVLALHSVCTDNDDMIEACKKLTNFEEALERYLHYVERERRKSKDDCRAQKIFRLRCGLVKDLAHKLKEDT